MIKKHGGNVHAFSKKTGLDLNEIIDFSANINPLGMSPGIKDALEAILSQAAHYPDPDYKKLVKRVAIHEQVKEDQIILGNGAIECIFILAEHLNKKHLHIQAPTFLEYERAFKKYQAHVSYDVLNHDDFYNTPETILKNTPDTVDVMVICNPNNPTGTLISKAHMLLLLKETKKRKITFIVDEAFIDFSEDEEAFSMVDQINSNPHLIVLKSLTKFYGIPGLRLGYCLSSNQTLVESIRKDRMPWAINSMVENIGILSLKDLDYIEKTKSFMATEREWFFNQLQTIHGLKVFPSQGNYLFFKSPCLTLVEDLVAKGIMIRDCYDYEGLEAGYYRIAVKHRAQNLALLENLKIILGS